MWQLITRYRLETYGLGRKGISTKQGGCIRTLLKFGVVALVVLVLQNEPPKRIEAQHINKEVKAPAVVETVKETPPSTPAPVAQPPQVQPKPVPQPASPNCGSEPYMAYIYQKESGCRTTALNSIGCYGIGQSCPASKIAHCGADWGCQNAWFTNYAVTRYGSTQQAYNFWLANHWW